MADTSMNAMIHRAILREIDRVQALVTAGGHAGTPDSSVRSTNGSRRNYCRQLDC